jgi:hypothetical protein
MPFRWTDPKNAPSELRPIETGDKDGTGSSAALVLRDGKKQRQGKVRNNSTIKSNFKKSSS